ncbi:acyltransferase [Rudanella lutea]|uniref:acyltransferase n=1 Tax=Rudanella lutea TaxID=451374 RepID=UPI000A019B52|nr:acyltransferase [Rudanella lutea]
MLWALKSSIRSIVSILSGINFAKGSYLSIPYLRLQGGKYIQIGQNSTIGKHAWLGAFDTYLEQRFDPSIIIHSNVSIGNHLCITAIDKVEIKQGCLLSEYVYISDHGHGTDANGHPPATQPLFSKGPVIIGENSFLGYRTTILSGVELGKHCVVGAHSVVNKSFPDYSVIAGSPARLIKQNTPC